MEEFSDVRFKQRAVIEFLTAEKVPPTEIQRRLQAVYGDQCVDVSTVRRWVRRFKDGELGQADLSDKTRSGRPATASDQLHQDRLEELIRENRRIKQKEISVALGISKERVGYIICVLGFRKVCARWVPRMLSDEMKAEKVRISRELLKRFEKEGEDFLKKIITCDETCVHHYDPENKRQSIEYRHKEITSAEIIKHRPRLERSC